MPLLFQTGDRVRLTRTAVSLYGGAWPHWVPEGQGGGQPGSVVVADENRPHDPRAAARPYLVRWDNGAVNSYREGDLEAADVSPVEPTLEETDDEGESEAGNIIPFRR